LFTQAREFVEQVYIPDLLAVAGVYKGEGWGAIGGGIGNFMSYGDFPATSINEPNSYFLPGGIIVNRDLSTVLPVDQAKIAEYVSSSWYEYSDGDAVAKAPFQGETKPNYTGPQPPYDMLNTDGKYSWVKAPRYDGRPMEVGPLARMLVAYAAGQPAVKELVDYVLKTLAVGPEALFSTLGRTAARGIETLLIARKLVEWTDEIVANVRAGDLRIHNGAKWDPSTWPAGGAKGWGHTEAPRGSLGHWVAINDGAITQYQCVVPSTWNASPRDPTGQRGPYEEAIIGTPLVDPERPVEILRTIHSFDPCMACAVHVLDPQGREQVRVRVA
jgi:hydrogenase large subunit